MWLIISHVIDRLWSLLQTTYNSESEDEEDMKDEIRRLRQENLSSKTSLKSLLENVKNYMQTQKDLTDENEKLKSENDYLKAEIVSVESQYEEVSS